jgi:hypothetical protein
MTAFLSGIGSAFFALSMKALGCRHHTIASLALAFLPVVYITSDPDVHQGCVPYDTNPRRRFTFSR